MIIPKSVNQKASRSVKHILEFRYEVLGQTIKKKVIRVQLRRNKGVYKAFSGSSWQILSDPGYVSEMKKGGFANTVDLRWHRHSFIKTGTPIFFKVFFEWIIWSPTTQQKWEEIVSLTRNLESNIAKSVFSSAVKFVNDYPFSNIQQAHFNDSFCLVRIVVSKSWVSKFS